MKRQHIASIYASPESFGGQTLTVCGWARTIRDMKNFGFIELNDGSCFKSLQVVLERGKLENYDDIARQNVGAAFIVHGELVLTPDAKQPFELKADSITLEGASAPDYPLQKSAQCGISAHDPASASAHESLQRDVPRAQRGGAGGAHVLPGARLRLCPDPDHHGLRLRGRGRDVPRHDP